MIERLIRTLQIFAAPADLQVARVPGYASRPEELALDFDDALRLVTDCPQIELAPHQRRSLSRVDDYLDQARNTPGFWTVSAIRTGAEWTELRKRAASALASLGAASDADSKA